ncbi:MAG: MarR family transcriptional regulator [Ectothiorhodospiraceae bacterium]|nr:MarR family transcriptional regulator [Ectothiorhodospiraceae bacterium]
MDSADSKTFMPLLRELVNAYQAFEHYALPHIKKQGLTPAQFYVIATLGNTPGMNFKQLAERTLLYKTTLTSVVDRLEDRGYVRRVPSQQDRRSTLVQLTPQGETLFNQVFPAHRAHLAKKFGQLTEDDIAQGMRFLGRLQQIFRQR